MVTTADAAPREEGLGLRHTKIHRPALNAADRDALLSAISTDPTKIDSEARRLVTGTDTLQPTFHTAQANGDEPVARTAVYRPGEDNGQVVVAQGRRPRPRGTRGPRGRNYYPPLTNSQYFRIQRLETEISGLRRELRQLGGREPTFASARPRNGYHNPRTMISGLRVQRDTYRDAVRDARRRQGGESDYRPPPLNSRPPSRAPRARSRLGKNLERAGYARPPGAAAHHIVAQNAAAARPARAVLRKYNIDINSAANGVWLPANARSPNPRGAAIHSQVHNGAYYARVNQALSRANSRSEALRALSYIRSGLLRGGY